MTSKLNLPANKFFVKDLHFCKWIEEENVWRFGFRHQNVKKHNLWNVVVVWIQGVVVQIDKITNSLMVDDGTGLAKVQNIICIPGGCDWICKGLYCMVIGQFIGYSSGTPVIQAMKVMHLNQSPLLEALWTLEVLDMLFTCHL